MNVEPTLTGVGVILAGLGGVAALIESVRKWVMRSSAASAQALEATQEILSTLNHLDEPIGNHPTIGQMIGRIDHRVDRVELKIDQLHTDVRTLSNAMFDHISDEGKRTRFLEERVRELDRRKWEAPGEEDTR